MVTHYRTAGHLACGRQGDSLVSTAELARVKCRSCRNTEAFKEARRSKRNAARRASRKAKAGHAALDWRNGWIARLSEMAGRQRLPRGFGDQPFV
ncbi:hypothetical protein P0Y43_19005 [Pseudomonas entomophila]|uniref:hypothetical protein n=1 Tax=Pseudomonas entomophila TaxID=312306 RepID=UPI0023D88265|nr:hypothetical protein [Pseudomonas entomophila]MDF0732781.1 hypothetical protein [Pseudomonas entomophila]